MSAIRDVTVPDIGDFKNIPIIEILVKAGDRVTKDSPLVVLESDKATLDVPSPEHGTINELKIAIGDRVSAGSLLLTLDVAAINGQSAPESRPAPPNVVSIVPAEVPSTSGSSTVPRSVTSHAGPRHNSHASPSVRRMANEFGVDLGTVQGTGPRGRVLRQDLQQFVKRALATPPASAVGENFDVFKLAPWPQIDFTKFGRIERAPLSKIRKISGVNLSRNAIVIPHVTNFEDADITELDAFRRTLNAEMRTSDDKLTILPFLLKAAAATLRKYTDFNSSLDGDELVLKHYCHVGFAVDTPNGLVVPVIRDVDTKGIGQIATEAAALAAAAREGKLKPTDMQGGCFTISSLGGIGGTGFTPIINAPEVAILGVVRAQMRPVWNGKEFQPRLVLPLTLSWDHRVIDGAAAARFLVHLSGLLADFRRVLL